MKAALVAAAVVLVAIPARAETDPDAIAIELSGDATVAVGATVELSLTVAPAADRQLSDDGSLRLKLSADPGLEVAPARLSRRDAVDPGARAPRFELRATGVSAGRHSLTVQLVAWSCGRYTCVPVRHTAAVPVTVTEPPAPEPAPPPSG